jgi:hypothetical protein
VRFLLVVCLTLMIAVPAQAATVRDDVGGGCAATRFTPAAGGLVTVTLRAAAGDWDLSVSDARSGHVHGRSAFSGARETVLAAGTAGRPLVARACRLRGPASRARVDFDFTRAAPVRRTFPAQLVRVPLTGVAALDRLEATGLDVTHNATPAYADVVLYSAGERARLLAAGFTAETRIADLRAVTARTLAQRAATPLPSGQATYRTLAEYGEQLKGIVAKYPAIARTVVAGSSIEGRPIEGVELAGNVNADDDGRPVFLVVGVHHAREWPAGEMPMEFALELAKLYGADARVTALLDRVRVIAIPVVNPDGFDISRTAGPGPGDNDGFTTLPLIVSDSAAYKRKNCRPTVGSEAVPCATRPALQGVDPNRNYGAFWGGVGSSTDPTAQNYRGTAPFSEPESEAIHKLSSTRSVTTIISHHTYTDPGVWLRQPGFCKTENQCSPDVDVVPDEAPMRALGDAMGQATGWRSALGWDIGEITGATEDWNYFTQGTLGYTPEQRGVNFHPDFEDAVVREYTGEDAGGAGGVREALLRAAEVAADPASHGVLSGTAPAGRTLRLTKAFDTATLQPGVVVKDKLDFTLKVPASGRFTWHVNQSTRPLSPTPESYRLTCEGPDGAVLEAREVVVARGQTVPLSLACGGPVAAAPTPTPVAVPPRLSLRAISLSTRRLNRIRHFSVRLRAVGGDVTGVRARLVRGRRTVASGSLRRLGSRSVSLRLRRGTRARSGTHRLIVTARAGGRTVSATRTLRLRR